MGKLGLIILAILILGGAYYFYSQKSTTGDNTTNPTNMETPTLDNNDVPEVVVDTDEPGADAAGGIELADSEVKLFVVDGGNFKFSLDNITVKKGDAVRIQFNNIEGFHDWVLDEFDARTNKLQAGQSETITFVADKAGTFEYYCSVGQHRQMGMKGTITVTE